MSVIGLDIGNETCVIGVANQCGIDVLLNEESNRETPAVVSFNEKQRFLGLAGAAYAHLNPKSTISQIKRLIGVKYKELVDVRQLPFEISKGVDDGVLIHLQYLDQRHCFTPVQIMGMLFAHLKGMAERDLKMSVSDCVIGIPSYFTELQRRAYLDAAEIAGLKVLRLIHDCTATALGYGIYKTDFPSVGASNVVLVDIGHCDTQVAVVAFGSGYMRVLAHDSDSKLGGRNFDEVLFRHFAVQFKEQYNIDVYSNMRASIRLRAACEKLKKVLSANSEAPLNIECLMDEKDVKGFIKREDFEKLSSDLLERIKYPCRKALAKSGLSVDKIHSVELVGSGSRIPAIMKILTSLFRREPGRTLNASECVARGCALQCAMLSPIFRVKEYEVQDSFPFSIGISSDEGPIYTMSNGALFPKGHPFPSVKVLTLHRKNAFHLELFYADQNELPSGVSPKISQCTIGPFQVSNKEKGKVKVRVELNLHGNVTIKSTSLIEDYGDDSTALTDTRLTPDKMEVDNNVSSDVANGVDASDCVQSNLSNMHTADKMRRGKIQRQTLPVSEFVYGGISRTELSHAQEKELLLTQQDLKMEQAKEKKNYLESSVYETRSKILNAYRDFATESERNKITVYLQQTEDWLYEDGYDESEVVYMEKLEDLKQLVDPIEYRYKDEEARLQAMRSLLNCIVEYRMAGESLPTSQKDAVISECNKAEQWLREKAQLQESVPKNVDPILLSSEIKEKSDTLDAICMHLMNSKASTGNPEDKMDEDMPVD